MVFLLVLILSADPSLTLIPGGVLLSPKLDRYTHLWEEGGRERRKLFLQTLWGTEMPGLCTPFYSLTLGDPCTLGVLLLQVLAHAANIWLWEEAGLLWWEEEGQRGYCLVDKEVGASCLAPILRNLL